MEDAYCTWQLIKLKGKQDGWAPVFRAGQPEVLRTLGGLPSRIFSDVHGRGPLLCTSSYRPHGF